MKKLNKQNGITLIALIITIIVMIILVAVTISMAINGGLFEKAGQATGDTRNAMNAEQALASGQITIGGKTYASIDDYIWNAPELKYMQEESIIFVYLKGSYYDYISSKSLDERENLFAKMVGKNSIEELIKDEYNNDRQSYESTVKANYPSYEIALNSSLVEEGAINEEEYATYYIENILNLKTDEEKEKEVIRLAKEIEEPISLEELRKIINEAVSNGGYTSDTEWLNEKIWDCYNENGFLKLSLTKPNGEKEELTYGMQNYWCAWNALYYINYVSNDNTMQFSAEDYRGKKAELIIPMNSEWKTFKIKVSDSDIRKYGFIEGQTWEEFIGNNMTNSNGYYISKREDGSIFQNRSRGIRYNNMGLGINTGTSSYGVLPTDKIISDTIYEINPIME